MEITVTTNILADIDKVWDYYTNPIHITKWNFASDDWCCPFAKNDLQVGGKLIARMESKDKKFGFDFGGVYDEIKVGKLISFVMGDARKVKVFFETVDTTTAVKIVFDAETENSIELQKKGWQAILDNFKLYVENYK